MATVYLAKDTELRREVAVKVLFSHLSKRRDVVARFQREARAAAGLDHPHILRVIDIGGGEPSAGPTDPPYIVLELVRGPSLKEWIDRRGAPMAELVACLGVAVCRALAVAHEKGIVHRDIKPANIMVAEGGRVVLADFGVARVTDEDSVVTKTGALLGTPSYMSPEQATAGELDARSDLYSLGATLYQLATGSLPFSGPTTRVIGLILAGEFVAPNRRNPVIGPDLSAAITKLMSLEPDHRFATAGEVADRLEAIARAGGIEDVEEALTEYFDNPSETSESLRETVIGTTLQAAHRAGDDGNLPRAMALADRVLALDNGNERALELVDSLGRRGRLKTIAVVATVTALLAGAGAAVALWPEDTPVVAAAPADAGMALDASGDAIGAVVSTADAGQLAAPVDAAPSFDARGRDPNRVVRPRRADAAPAPRALDAGTTVVTPTADAAAAPPKKASFSLKADTWCNLSIDGTAHGRLSAAKRYRVDAGKRALVCEQPGLGRAWKQTVTFSPGETRNLSASLLERLRVKISVSKGDRVRIGGKTYKNGSRLTLKRGSRSVEVLSGSRVITKKLVKFVTSCTIEDSPRLVCAK